MAPELTARNSPPPQTGLPSVTTSASPLRAEKIPLRLQPPTTCLRTGIELLKGRSYDHTPPKTWRRSNSDGPYSALRLKLLGVTLAEFWTRPSWSSDFENV